MVLWEAVLLGITGTSEKLIDLQTCAEGAGVEWRTSRTRITIISHRMSPRAWIQISTLKSTEESGTVSALLFTT